MLKVENFLTYLFCFVWRENEKKDVLINIDILINIAENRTVYNNFKYIKYIYYLCIQKAKYHGHEKALQIKHM